MIELLNWIEAHHVTAEAIFVAFFITLLTIGQLVTNIAEARVKPTRDAKDAEAEAATRLEKP